MTKIEFITKKYVESYEGPKAYTIFEREIRVIAAENDVNRRDLMRALRGKVDVIAVGGGSPDDVFTEDDVL